MEIGFFHLLRSFEEYKKLRSEYSTELVAQRRYEEALLNGRDNFNVEGFCVACSQSRALRLDLKWANDRGPNWRERLECECGCNSRARACLDVLLDLAGGKSSLRIYASEQISAFFRAASRRFPQIVGSEFLRDGTERGKCNLKGIRHEDLTALTFPNASFDIALAFEVLEHIPKCQAGFSELYRILSPGGLVLISVPFDPREPKTIVRATKELNGEIIHHMPAEFHGDPITRAGCLCFRTFAWDMLEELKNVGFSDAWVVYYWSADRGYLGDFLTLIIAQRSP